MEEEARVKATMADQNYRQQLQTTNASRQEYFQTHLPKILSVSFFLTTFYSYYLERNLWKKKKDTGLFKNTNIYM